ncbi:hypothetical protein HK104_005221 [Borealophlyctis nickersoniae]|nr:hypothetical protein HK104_005221 [Borealophlyctis nickersoniae]
MADKIRKPPRKLKHPSKAASYSTVFYVLGLTFVGILALYFLTLSSSPKLPTKATVAPVKQQAPKEAVKPTKYWAKEIITPGFDQSTHTSSRDRGKPFETQIGVGMLIRGWDEAVPTMSVGERAKLTIQHQAAYGKERQGIIPPKATLIFDMELLDIKK